MRKHGIYVLENTTTGKQYVGQSIDVNKRKQEHFNSMQKGKHHNDYIQQDYNRGHDFSFGVLEYCELSSLNQREKYWINRLNTYNKGYNLTSGGGKTFVYVDQTPKKSWQEIHLNRSKRELENYNRRIKRLKKWTHPVVLILMILLATIGRQFTPWGLILFYSVILIYLIQFLTLYSAKKDYNFAVTRLKEYGIEKKKLGSVTIKFIKIIITNIKNAVYDILYYIKYHQNLTNKEDIFNYINGKMPINDIMSSTNKQKETEESNISYNIIKSKRCPSCNTLVTEISKKCPKCKYNFEDKN